MSPALPVMVSVPVAPTRDMALASLKMSVLFPAVPLVGPEISIVSIDEIAGRTPPAAGRAMAVKSSTTPLAVLTNDSVSLPSPPPIEVSLTSKYKTSLPSPPNKVSAPKPPVKVSLPARPLTVSLPSPPLTASLLLPPVYSMAKKMVGSMRMVAVRPLTVSNSVYFK